MTTKAKFQIADIVQIAISLLILLAMWYLNYVKSRNSTTDPNVALAIRQANSEHREALNLFKEEALKNEAYFRSKDSANEAKMDSNAADIKKSINYTNEKINAIHTYNSDQLVRAFAELNKK